MRQKEEASRLQQELEDGPLYELPPPHALLIQSILADGALRSQGGLGVLSPQACGTTLSWVQWIECLDLFLVCLEEDLAALEALRAEAGLMKEKKKGPSEEEINARREAQERETDEEREARLRQEEEEKEKAARAAEREKEKQRRAMKKNRGKKAVMEEIAAEIEAEAVADGAGGGEAGPSPEELERQRKVAQREARRAQREKLAFRLDDAARAAAGRDCILSTVHRNGRGRVNKICLDMSYLGDDDMSLIGDKKDNKSGSGLGSTWIEGRGGGHAGVVCADTVMGGAGYFSFGKAVPREKWVHVSFVGVKEEGQNRMTMFLDAFSAGQVKENTFPLPLSAFGGCPGNDSCSVCLLDTRIWTKPRSNMELRGTMNTLLDLNGPTEPALANYDLTVRGLVGWWTFEDGPKDPGEEQIDDAVDVSEHRPPTQLDRYFEVAPTNLDHDDLYAMNSTARSIVTLQNSPGYVNIQALPPEMKGMFWRWENADELPLPNEKELKAGEDRPLPVPAFSAIGLCPFELSRLRLAQKGRLLQKQVNCTLGCDAFILKKDLRFHLMYQCEMRHVECRFAPYCSVTFPEYERKAHEENMCQHLQNRRVLEKRFRENSAVKECVLCGSMVKVRDREKHDAERCPHRIITCPHEDCQELLQAHRLSYHLKFECESVHVKVKATMIMRARERVGYTRDWAFPVIEYKVGEEEEERERGEDDEGIPLSVEELKEGDNMPPKVRFEEPTHEENQSEKVTGSDDEVSI